MQMHSKGKKEFPSGMFGAFIPVLLLFSIRKIAPEKPITIPITFFRVIFSFKKNRKVLELKLGRE